MTTELASRIDRVLTMLLGALFVTGAVWCTLAVSVGSWPGFASLPVFSATVATAYVIGGGTLWWGWARGPVDWRLAAALVATGSLAVALVSGSSGAIGATALGGLYTYVAAISFLWFSLPVALGQLTFAGVVYAVALREAGAEGAPATWLVAMGIAAGGAGVVGALASRFRRLYLAETEVAIRLRETDELKSTFLQAVSHELRTPLAAVRGYTETLDHHLPRLGDEEVAHMLGRLRGASERLDVLLTDLLDVERLQRGSVEARRAPCEIARLVAGAAEQVETRDHEVEMDVTAFVADVEAAKVERIVVNLLGNAVKHSPPGTRVVVRAREWGHQGLELEVADNGPGLDPGLDDRVFQPFEQGRGSLRAPSPGIGLGLAIVERFVELHDGEIWSEPGLEGRGISFRLQLPGAAVPSAADADETTSLATST
jgi:signal transduction histidine kinase